MSIARLVSVLPLAALASASPALGQTMRDAPAPQGSKSVPRLERSGTEVGLTFGAIAQLKQHDDFRPMPLGLRAGYQLDTGFYLGAAGEWSLNVPDDQTAKAFYYQVAGELGYDYSPLASFGAIPFVRAGHVSTFQSHCEDRVLPAPCDVSRDAGAIGQVGFRYLFRFRHFESGLELHYQFGTLQNIGLRFSNAVRF